MRWFRRASAETRADVDPGRQEALAQEIRQRFGPTVRVRFQEQAHGLAPMLESDDGLLVAVRVVRDVAEEAYAAVYAQVAEVSRQTGHRYAVDRRNYRALWRHFGAHLRTPLFSLRSGFHPYVHLSAAVAVIGVHAQRCVKLTPAVPVLTHLLEILDLTTAGWEFGGVPADPDGGHLVNRLISVTRTVIDTMDEPPPLPPSIREVMRSNRRTDLVDQAAGTVVGRVNLGEEMRRTFLT